MVERRPICVDLGCHDHGGSADSISELIREYNPRVLYGFDAHPATKEGRWRRGETTVIVERKAAWDSAGTVPMVERGTGTEVHPLRGEIAVPCFDFSKWLREHATVPTMVKMDIEGSEYVVLEKMKRDDTDRLVAELLVEYHGPEVEGLRCPTRKWWM